MAEDVPARCRSRGERASEKRRPFILRAAGRAAFLTLRIDALCCGKWGTPPENLGRFPRGGRGRGAITTLHVERCRCSRAVRGETMSDPSPTTYRFNTRNKRSGRLRIEAGRMRTGIVVLAQLLYMRQCASGDGVCR